MTQPKRATAMPPDPMGDPKGYGLWCELNACPACEGVGEDWLEDEYDIDAGEYGKAWVCSLCGGTGIDPAAIDGGSDDE